MLGIMLKATQVGEQMETSGLKKLLDQFNQSTIGSIAETIDKILNLWPIVVFFLALFLLLLTFKSKVTKDSEKYIDQLSNNRKYIRGLFVELNDTKELLRYFMHGKGWRNRIIQDYNALFDDDGYGRLLREVYSEQDMIFKIKRNCSIEKVCDTISNTLDFMSKVHSKEIKGSKGYEDSEVVFHYSDHGYIKKLETLKSKAEFARNKYIVLTGSAGNGKTNLLCNIAELLVESGRICLFMNAKDITTDVQTYFENKFRIFNQNIFSVYWPLQQLLCWLFNRTVYIIVDAINENDRKEFCESLPNFLTQMLKYKKIKIIVACRSEYFELRYKKFLLEEVDAEVYQYDIMKESYSDVAKKRMLENYKKKFNFQGNYSNEVEAKLCQQLLLMRVFFEAYKNTDVTVNTLNKYDVFQKYIDSVMGENKNECNEFLDKVVANMYRNKEYSSVKLSAIMSDNNLSENIRNVVDDTILLSKRLVLHPDSIIERIEEEIYFVFDEMRDYCVAKYILNLMIGEDDNPVESKILSCLAELVETNSVCTEGVINYIYRFYKGEGNTQICTSICEKFMKEHDRTIEAHGRNHEEGINSWGLKAILEGNGILENYEKDYVKFIVLENPGNELSRFFKFLIQQEEQKGKFNLDLYLDVLYDIHEQQTFCEALKGCINSWYHEGIRISDFIPTDKKLADVNPNGCTRFRYFMFLFMNFLHWEEKDKLQRYFNRVCNEEEIYRVLKQKIFFVAEEVDADEHEI